MCDAAGRLYHPDTLSDFWRALCSDAGVSRIRLHDARHTCVTLMHMQNLPIVVIAEWLGHADPAFTMRTYVHSQNDALHLAAETWQRDTGRGLERDFDATHSASAQLNGNFRWSLLSGLNCIHQSLAGGLNLYLAGKTYHGKSRRITRNVLKMCSRCAHGRSPGDHPRATPRVLPRRSSA